MADKKSIAKKMAQDLGKLGGETLKEAGSQATQAVNEAVSELTGSGSKSGSKSGSAASKPKTKKTPASKPKVDFQWKQKNKQEIDQIKQSIQSPSNSEKPQQPKGKGLELGGKAGAQDMEKQIEKVRKNKETKEKQTEEEEMMAKLKKQREEEEAAAMQDAQELLPGSDRPQRGSALSKRKKKSGGTGEMAKLKN